jgi:hypothetical protein
MGTQSRGRSSLAQVSWHVLKMVYLGVFAGEEEKGCLRSANGTAVMLSRFEK